MSFKDENSTFKSLSPWTKSLHNSQWNVRHFEFYSNTVYYSFLDLYFGIEWAKKRLGTHSGVWLIRIPILEYLSLTCFTVLYFIPNKFTWTSTTFSWLRQTHHSYPIGFLEIYQVRHNKKCLFLAPLKIYSEFSFDSHQLCKQWFACSFASTGPLQMKVNWNMLTLQHVARPPWKSIIILLYLYTVERMLEQSILQMVVKYKLNYLNSHFEIMPFIVQLVLLLLVVIITIAYQNHPLHQSVPYWQAKMPF